MPSPPRSLDMKVLAKRQTQIFEPLTNQTTKANLGPARWIRGKCLKCLAHRLLRLGEDLYHLATPRIGCVSSSIPCVIDFGFGNRGVDSHWGSIAVER